MDRAAFERDGAWRFERRLTPDQIDALRTLADERIGDRPGTRLDGEVRLAAFQDGYSTTKTIEKLSGDAA